MHGTMVGRVFEHVLRKAITNLGLLHCRYMVLG